MKYWEKERLEKEGKCGKGIYDRRNKTLYIENIPLLYQAAQRFLRCSHLYLQGKQNALDVQTRWETWYFPNLPAAFSDFKILQISDLHIDALPELAEILPPLIKAAKADMVVFTGDYRFGIHKPDLEIDGLLKKIIEEAVKAEFGAFAILGNHDYYHYTQNLMQDTGLDLLVNTSRIIRRKSSSLLLLGLDDPHYYRTGRLFDFKEDIAAARFTLLLAHSPELYRQAALSGIDLYLCGHTHGGQICLPGGIPLISNSRSGKKYNAGRWQYGSTFGYTSAGAGASGLPLRWNCPPEITLHWLKVKK